MYKGSPCPPAAMWFVFLSFVNPFSHAVAPDLEYHQSECCWQIVFLNSVVLPITSLLPVGSSVMFTVSKYFCLSLMLSQASSTTRELAGSYIGIWDRDSQKDLCMEGIVCNVYDQM